TSIGAAEARRFHTAKNNRPAGPPRRCTRGTGQSSRNTARPCASWPVTTRLTGCSFIAASPIAGRSADTPAQLRGEPVGDVLTRERHVVRAHMFHTALARGEDLQFAPRTVDQLLMGLVCIGERNLPVTEIG